MYRIINKGYDNGTTGVIYYLPYPTTHPELTVYKRYELLASLPTYGPMYIPVTEHEEPFYSEGFVVRFHKTDGTQWVANFKPGWTNLKAIIELTDSANLLVIALGICYLMNPDQTKPLSVFGINYLTILTTENGKIILQAQTYLTIVEPNGAYWHTERISWNGLKELKIDKNIVTGFAYDPTNASNEWVKFSCNIRTKELIGGNYPRPDKIKKPKWRFW